MGKLVGHRARERHGQRLAEARDQQPDITEVHLQPECSVGLRAGDHRADRLGGGISRPQQRLIVQGE